MRWLTSHLPRPAQKLVLVHGDYRTGNFLFSKSGEITAILDWEMAHLGDPLEDLAWSLDLRQAIAQPVLAGSLLPHRQAIDLWIRSSGLKVDRVAFRLWQIFAAFKALSIWSLSAKRFVEGNVKRPTMARIGWLLSDRQQRILLDYLSPFCTRQFFEYDP
jgi:aminoglycoside phosphotransferase (APT) family kinase protein